MKIKLKINNRDIFIESRDLTPIETATIESKIKSDFDELEKMNLNSISLFYYIIGKYAIEKYLIEKEKKILEDEIENKLNSLITNAKSKLEEKETNFF
jgi:hypothetical protein